MATKKKEEKGAPKEVSNIILSPRITEKSAYLSEQNAYTFNVSKGATKNEIIKEVKRLHNVNPVKVTVTTIKPRRVFVRGKVGVQQGGKKAIVFLKKGETISFA